MDAQPLSLLPGRGLPAGTPEGSVVEVRAGALRRPVECLAHLFVVYTKQRFDAIQRAKVAKARRLLPGVNALGFRA